MVLLSETNTDPSQAEQGLLRKSILQAAQECFGAKGFHAVTMGELARAAGTDIGSIRFFFNDKIGLYRALLQESVTHVLDLLYKCTTQCQEGESPIALFLDRATQAASQHPWVRHMLIHEVLSENASQREFFIENFARRTADMLPQMIQHEVQLGRLQQDTNPKLASIALLGMTLFPFLTAPILSQAFDIRVDKDFASDLVEQCLKWLA